MVDLCDVAEVRCLGYLGKYSYCCPWYEVTMRSLSDIPFHWTQCELGTAIEGGYGARDQGVVVQ
jgi:hypothetical protein